MSSRNVCGVSPNEVCVDKWLNEWIRNEKTEKDRRCFKMKNERNSKFDIVVIL